MAELSGRMLGQYRLNELIGVGGMAAVYRARQESMDRDVAIKVMAAQLSGSEEFVARFEREARVIAKLQHPHILPVIDFGRESGQIYLVMRLVEGGVLSQRLAQTTLSIRQTDRFLTQITSALEYAHQRGVIHRDLKPNNVLLDEQDNVYLTDFGIAKMLAGTSASQISLTATGSVMGTPAYMAPEQWRSEPVDARTDIYALGIILYEMLMGVLPFLSDTPFGMMYKHFDALPPLPRVINPSLPEPVEQIVLRALAKNANDRYASARQMAEDFNAAVRMLPPDWINLPLPRATAEQIAQATPPAQSRPTVGGIAPAYAPMPPYDNGPVYVSPPTATIAHPAPKRSRGRGILARGALVAVIVAGIVVAAVIGLLAMGGNHDDGGKTEPAGISAGEAETGTPDIAAPEQTQPPPETAPTQVAVVIATDKPSLDLSPEPSTTPSTTPSITPSRTSTVPPTPIPTLPPPPTRTPRLPPPTRPLPTRTPPCSAMRSRIDVNQGARTTLSPDTTTRIRRSPGFSGSTAWQIPAGQTFWVTDGPQCVDGVLWWRVEGYNPSGFWSGWIGEGRNEVYWIEPFETGPVDCPGAPPPRLAPGKTGRITVEPPLPSRIRSSPRIGPDNVVGQLQPGETFDVISGPVCDTANHWRWWLVRGASITGWVAEGPTDEYWMEPWP
jgi:serine/threonine protein kinase